MTQRHRDLNDVVRAFESRNPGVRSLETLSQDCQSLGRRDPDNSAIYALIGFVAINLVERLEGRVAKLDEASDLNEKLLTRCKDLAASMDNDPSSRITAMNELVIEFIG